MLTKLIIVLVKYFLQLEWGKRIVAETGAGQHGLATATVCALFNLKCIVYMGETDIKRQAPNVFKNEITRC